MPNNTSSIPLANVIKGLRKELSEAIAAGDGEDIRFQLGPVELEFQVEVSLEAEGKAGAKGGIQFGVISLGEVSGETTVSRSQGTIHTIKLTLNPVTADGNTVEVSDQSSHPPG